MPPRTRSWARELAPFGITVNAVAPGFIPVERPADVPAGTVDAYLASVPVGRMGTPEDIAHAITVGALISSGDEEARLPTTAISRPP